MLLQYKLSNAARVRLFYEGITPGRTQMLEADLMRLPPLARSRIHHLAHPKEAPTAVPGVAPRICLELDGEYDAINLTELLSEINQRASRRQTIDRMKAEEERLIVSRR